MSSILVYCTLSVLGSFLIYKGEWFKRGAGKGRKAVNSMCLSSPHMKEGERQILTRSPLEFSVEARPTQIPSTFSISDN